MKKYSGFTLIELVIVIIVLAILAATAVPKFINIQDDAKESALKGLLGALNSAVDIVHSKSVIDGNEQLPNKFVGTLSSGLIKTNYGYPQANARGIGSSIEVSGFTSTESSPIVGAKVITFYLDDDDTYGACTLVYQEATSSAGYQIWFGTNIKSTTPDCS